MSKFTCLIMCVVAASLSSVQVSRAESFRDAIRPIIVQCSKEHGVTDADIQAAKDASKAGDVSGCFIDCVLRKAGLINEKGEYDAETFSKNISGFVKDAEQSKKLVEVANQCSSVKDSAKGGVSECDLGVRVADCFLSHQTSIII